MIIHNINKYMIYIYLYTYIHDNIYIAWFLFINVQCVCVSDYNFVAPVITCIANMRDLLVGIECKHLFYGCLIS